MELQFIPAIAPSEVRALQEVLAFAVTGSFANDLLAYENEDGSITKYLRIGRKVVNIQVNRLIDAGRASIRSGLKASEISVLVQSKTDGRYYRVPRLYWFVDAHLDHEELHLDPDAPDYMPSLDGQPLLADVSLASSWVAAAGLTIKPAAKEAAPSTSAPLKPAPAPAKKIGRASGSYQYESDAKIIDEIIAALDAGQFKGPARLTRAIKSRYDDVEPANLADASKLARLRPRIVDLRPDLAEAEQS